MFKFLLLFIAFCLIQISSAGGIYKKIKNTFRKRRKFGEKEYVLVKNDLVKITSGQEKGKVGILDQIDVNNKWSVKLNTGTVYSKPENLMIVNNVNGGLSRLTPYDSEVQLWGNTNDLIIIGFSETLILDIPPNIDPPWLPEAKTIQNLLRENEWKKLLNFLLKNPDIMRDRRLKPQEHSRTKQPAHIPFLLHDALLTALASRVTPHELKNEISEAYETRQCETTLLHIAVILGNVAVMARLLEEAELRRHAEIWSLELAIREKNEHMCEFLLQWGVNVNGQHMTPLILSITQNSAGCFKVILNNKDVNIDIRNMWDDRSALHFAAMVGTGEMCEALVKKHAKIDEMAKDNYNQEIGTPLMFAAEFGNIECLKVLLKSKANINLKRSGETALMIAAEYGNTECLKVLLNYKAKVHLKRSGETALMIAVKHASTDCMKELLKHTSNEDIASAIKIAEQGRKDYVDYLRGYMYRLVSVHRKVKGNGKSIKHKRDNITNAITI